MILQCIYHEIMPMLFYEKGRYNKIEFKQMI